MLNSLIQRFVQGAILSRLNLSLSVLLVLYCTLYCTTSNAKEPEQTKPSLDIGAQVYSSRCVLCHGRQGMGEGVLALKLKDYPSTTLFKDKLKAKEELKDIIVNGGTLEYISGYMPPYGQELTWTELESVTLFIELLHSDNEKAHTLVAQTGTKLIDTNKLGREVYSTRCVLCHGDEGEGDGRMARLLKNPPQVDLTKSRLPDDYLEKIISLGGKAVGRTDHMPPWKDQLSKEEIEAVIAFIKSIRD